MNYQSLIYFKTVAELQHYTRAANALYITQPALSKAIRNLEIELGTNLFQKDGRNVTLTQYGSLFYEYVKRSVDEIDKGIAAVRHLVEVECNTIFVSALFSMYAFYLPDKLLRFRRLYPNHRFSMEYKYTSSIIQDVLDGHSELGLCSDFDIDEELSCLEVYPLFTEPLSLIVPKDHPFASRKKVSIPELQNERFIVYIKSNRGTNKILNDMCASCGFQPNIYAEAYTDYGVVGMVTNGDGLAIISASGFLNINSVVPVELDLPGPLMRNINLIWRKDRKMPPAAAAFRDLLIEISKEEKENIPPKTN